MAMQLRGLLTESGRMFRFGLVGLLATLVYVVVTAAANEAFGVAPVLASIVGQSTSTAVSYFGHSSFSFRVEPNHRDFLWRFLAIAALAFALAAGVTWLIADVAWLSPRIAIAAVTVLIPIVNYLCNRFWVFRAGLKGATPAPAAPPAKR
jgi:putative flippase GtrA